MLTVSEQVVSKIREVTEGLPAMQKRLLESAAQESGWEIAPALPLPAVYCIFDEQTCVYVGQTANMQRRLRSHVLLQGKHRLSVYSLLLKDKVDAGTRRRLEFFLAVKLRPSRGFIRRQAYLPDNVVPEADYHYTRCEHAWKPRTGTLPLRCPRCGSPKWNKPTKKAA